MKEIDALEPKYNTACEINDQIDRSLQKEMIDDFENEYYKKRSESLWKNLPDIQLAKDLHEDLNKIIKTFSTKEMDVIEIHDYIEGYLHEVENLIELIYNLNEYSNELKELFNPSSSRSSSKSRLMKMLKKLVRDQKNFSSSERTIGESPSVRVLPSTDLEQQEIHSHPKSHGTKEKLRQQEKYKAVKEYRGDFKEPKDYTQGIEEEDLKARKTRQQNIGKNPQKYNQKYPKTKY
mmetsp:Transcript_32782/g.37485  ORF Transcript_32782/g.37485 Transcript_32782/m.37485 type:complete len:235 (+) Transcript_32782:1739-2443(+)